MSGKTQILSWTHYRNLLRVTDKNARDWYLNESINEVWSARTLDRNIASQYYYRLLQSQNKSVVKTETERLFQARYLTYLRSIDQLKEEIELQKEQPIADCSFYIYGGADYSA